MHLSYNFFERTKKIQCHASCRLKQRLNRWKRHSKKWKQKKLELEQQKNDSHFFKKLTLEPQLMAIKGKLHGLQKQRDEQIISIGNSVLTDDVITEVRGACFPDPLEAVYSELRSIVIKQDEIEERKETLIAEQKKLDETLAECGAENSPQKRITVLTAQIKKKG